LPIFFHGAAGDETLGATFDGAGIDANVFHPIQIERNTAIGFEGAAAQVGESGIGGGKRCFQIVVVEALGAAGTSVDYGHGKISFEEGASNPREILSL
jgi:hypothetical protein